MLSFYQAYSTELLADEAYYWLYSKALSWGYFDHPPFIAFLIKIGFGLFQNELGVRLVPIVLFVAGIYLIEKTIVPKNFLLFASLIASLGALHFLSFVATPDTPLFFFGAFYFFILKKQLQLPTSKNSILLGVMIGFMLLSKYLGVLLILFTLLANLSLVKSKFFWITAFSALIIFMPHIYWLAIHDFISIKYHLFGRTDGEFNWSHLFNYVGSVFVFYAPFTGLLVFYGVVKSGSLTAYDRTLKIILFGILLLCLLLTIRGNIEINWIVLTLIPLAYLGYQFLENHLWAQKWHYRFFIVSMGIIMLARFAVGSDWAGNTLVNTPIARFHGKKESARILQETLGDDPVVFINSFQRASLYAFYTGQSTYSYNSITARKNQFDLWTSQFNFNNKKAKVVLNYIEPALDSVVTPNAILSYYPVSNFYSLSNVRIETAIPREAPPEQELSFDLTFKNYEQHLDVLPQIQAELYIYFQKDADYISDTNERLPLTREMLEKGFLYKTKTPRLPGCYSIRLGLACGPLPPTLNSSIFKIEIQ